MNLNFLLTVSLIFSSSLHLDDRNIFGDEIWSSLSIRAVCYHYKGKKTLILPLSSLRHFLHSFLLELPIPPSLRYPISHLQMRVSSVEKLDNRLFLPYGVQQHLELMEKRRWVGFGVDFELRGPGGSLVWF